MVSRDLGFLIYLRLIWYRHLEITAFLASLLKVIHILNRRIVPPNVNLREFNPRITWDPELFHVPTVTASRVSSSNERLLASLSSFGIGGANGHVVLEGTSPKSAPPKPIIQSKLLLIASGLSPRSTTTVSEDILTFLQSQPKEDWSQISTLYGRRARQMSWRSFACASVDDVGSITFSQPKICKSRRPLVVVFAGQGPQYPDMGRELFATYSTFRDSILEMDATYESVTGHSLIKTYGYFTSAKVAEDAKSCGDWVAALPALAMFQIASYDLLLSLGLQPDAVLGHSAGETSVLYASGAGDKALAIKLSIARSKLMTMADAIGGTMAAVACGVDLAEEMVATILVKTKAAAGSLSLVCYNAHDSIVIGGLVELIDAFAALAKERGVWFRKLNIPVPMHSPLLDVLKEDGLAVLASAFDDRGVSPPTKRTFSTVTGKQFTGLFDAAYFWRNAREPVQFHHAIHDVAHLYADAVYVEISPHPALSTYLTTLTPPTSMVVNICRRPPRDQSPVEQSTFVSGVGQLVCAGYNVDFNVLNDNFDVERKIQLPPYPFKKKAVPFHADNPSYNRRFSSRQHILVDPNLRLNAATHPLLAQHVIHGVPIMPAAGYIEMVGNLSR
jgi:acyl transferase domain-containing protein